MRTATGVAALLLGSVGLTGAGAVGAGAAQAVAYDPAALCASATPNAAAMETTVNTIRSNTLKAATVGFTFTSKSASETEVYRFDAAGVRARYDAKHTNTKIYSVHWITQAGSPTYYDGHLRADGDEEVSALRALKLKQAWVKATLDPEEDYHPGTRVQMLDQLVDDQSDLFLLGRSAQDTKAVHAFTCSVQAGMLKVTDAYDAADEDDTINIARTFTATFTDSGALKTLRRVDVENGRTYPGTSEQFAYGVVTLPLPVKTVTTQKRWDAAVVQGTFEDLKNETAAAARLKVTAATTYAARVTAVRKVAKQKASTYYQSDPTVTAVAGGARVSAKKADSSTNWWFRLKVEGAKVKVTSNLP